MKIRHLALGILLVLGSAAYGQVDTAAFSQIRRAGMGSSQIPHLAHYLTDVPGPRLSASAAYLKAAKWAVKTLKSWGLQRAALEPWGTFGKQWELEDFSIIQKKPYVLPVTAYPQAWSGSTKGRQQGGVVLLSSQQARDTVYLGTHQDDLKGKFVLVAGRQVDPDFNTRPALHRLTDAQLDSIGDTHMLSEADITEYGRAVKISKRADELFKSSGALAVLSAGGANHNGAVFVQGTGAYKPGAAETLPKVILSFEDGQRMRRLIMSGHPVELALNLQARFSAADVQGYNVIAEIPGSDPRLKSEIVMLGAHLDSWAASTGATDNAAGCVVMMEAIRLLDSLGLKPKRTIRIALWDGEEQAMYGSYFYVQKHFMDKAYRLKPEHAKISAYFNLDNGSGKIRGIFTQNNERIKPIFETWLQPLHDLGARTVTLRNTGSTDHLAFDWAGIPGFQFIQDPLDYETRTHHSNLDSYEHLQFEDLKQAAVIVACFVYQAAMEEQMLPRKPPEKRRFLFDGY
ncbi:peptidase M28 [Pedobacter yulinensis]|uniref:Carboxypeptidase Q n=1 Tax=Pedobacter yulinensis TaxID=2126353 RepID=A0A2T3HPI9_9SPHI|nr:M20/M25/M40 family metallo-hydrolase [Pedobacter yulinensis]PST84323.1 peptidase M28 [Pedobacter yulinensis]